MRLALIGIVVALCAATAAGGPQHWGFGFGYLVTLEENAGGQRALSVYEPPLRVSDGPWRLRWRDAGTPLDDVLPNGVAVGAFWPEAMGEAHVVLITRDDAGDDWHAHPCGAGCVFDPQLGCVG